MQKVKSSSRPGAAAEAEASRLACPRPRRSRCDWRSAQCDPSPLSTPARQRRRRAATAPAAPARAGRARAPPPPASPGVSWARGIARRSGRAGRVVRGVFNAARRPSAQRRRRASVAPRDAALRAAFVAPARVLSRRAFPLAPCSLLQDELPSTAAAQRLAAWPDPRMAFSRAARLRGAAAARLQPRAAPAAPARARRTRAAAPSVSRRALAACPSLPRRALAPAVRRASAPPRARRFSEELECMRFGRPSVFKVRQSRISEYSDMSAVPLPATMAHALIK